jgi:hypothetical protein
MPGIGYDELSSWTSHVRHLTKTDAPLRPARVTSALIGFVEAYFSTCFPSALVYHEW